MEPATARALGVHSEVGPLRTVMVHQPDLAHERLSPASGELVSEVRKLWLGRQEAVSAR